MVGVPGAAVLCQRRKVGALKTTRLPPVCEGVCNVGAVLEGICSRTLRTGRVYKVSLFTFVPIGLCFVYELCVHGV